MKIQFAAKSALFVSLCLLTGAVAAAADAQKAPDPALVKAVADPARTPKFVARDPARHPAEELTFFGLTPKMTVIEVWPGGGYWTEILGPYLKTSGHYIAAVPPKGENEEEDKGTAAWCTRMEAQKDRIGTRTTTGRG